MKEKKKETENKQVSFPLGVEFLTRKESANFLRISIASFDKIKDIECIRYGKSKRFSIDALRNYARSHTERVIK